MCPGPKSPALACAQGDRRRKIWEVRPSCSCLICGTCFSIAELRKIAVKAKLCIPDDAADYAIHGHFVDGGPAPGPTAKLLQKALDRKYRTIIERCRHLKSEQELRAVWDAALNKGAVPGHFWALMTHPAISENLAVHIFGEVHMLSHLEGHSHRFDRRRVAVLEQENAELTLTRSVQASASQRRFDKRDREAQALRRQLNRINGVEDRLEDAQARLRRYEMGEETQRLGSRVVELEALLAQRDRDIADTEKTLARQRGELDERLPEVASLKQKLELVEAECDALASLTQEGACSAMGPGAAVEAMTSCPFDLSGRSVLYVGGRSSLVVHFRNLVERANGRFFHHDGGIEANERRLDCLLARGDIVLCPVDCVSHQACIKAKRYCKGTAKIFVPLRSSGLSSFVSGLRQATADIPKNGTIEAARYEQMRAAAGRQ